MPDELVALLQRHPAFASMQRLGEEPTEFLEYMDEEGIQQAWLIQYHAEDTMGYGRKEAEAVWRFCEADEERLVAVGGYRPAEGDPAVHVEDLRSHGVRVLKIHPVHQHLDPGDPRLAGLWEAAADAGMPVVVHTGPSVFPGADNAYADPGLLAPVLAAHPRAQVIIGHGGRPDATQTAVELVERHDNAWLDLSGCPPKRLHQYFGDLEALAARTLWGTDWPGPGVPGLAANVEAFMALGLSEEAQRAILVDNATRLLQSA